MTQLALCLNSTGGCSFMRIYTVWPKVRWKRGKRINDRIVCVYDNQTRQLYHIDIDQFKANFRILSERELIPNLWKDIRDERKKTATTQAPCAKKKAP